MTVFDSNFPPNPGKVFVWRGKASGLRTRNAKEHDDELSVECIAQRDKTSDRKCLSLPTSSTCNMPPSPPRRSGRQCVSTVIQIDGYAVRKDNNYVVKGHGYHFGDNTTTQEVPQSTPFIRRATTKQPKQPRVVTPIETGRLQHKNAIQQHVAAHSNRRLAYLARHLPILSPFLDEGTVAKLQQHIATSPRDEQGAELQESDDVAQPKLIQVTLRDYQLVGLNWMVKMDKLNLGMILGDEMGLGKTLQTIALLAHLKELGRNGPSLVLCPLSVLYSWCTELTKWAPSLKILRFHSSCQSERTLQRDLLVRDFLSYDVVVTTYEMGKQPLLRNMWSRHYFQYLILDEGHKIKDADSQISQAVRAIHCENKLILTGTPLQNNLVELWALLNFLHPDIFLSPEPFRAAFDLTANSVDKDRLHEAQQVLRLFMLRRLKVQVETTLPLKIETKVLCPLSNTQVYWYKSLLLKDLSVLVKATERIDDAVQAPTTTPKGKVLNNLFMQLRKCCLHPYLFSGAEPPDVSLQELIGASGKLSVLDMVLRSLYKKGKGHRTVLFSQFTSVLDILEDYCNLRGWSYGRFDGSTARASRNHLVTNFQNSDSPFIFLMSTRSGGMGLNLQAADTCILYDSDWNPQPDLQAMARVHRIGQTRTVHVYRLISRGTIEERMVERAEKKLYMDQMVNSTASTSGARDDVVDEVDVTEKDLVTALQFGCNAVFGDDADMRNNLPTEEDIEIITDRSRTSEHSAGMLKGGVAASTDNFQAEKEFSSSTKFGGIDFQKIRDDMAKKRKRTERLTGIPSSLSGIADDWKKLQNKKRQSQSRLIMVNGISSGYGKAYVPVLAANNYDLQNGEDSVFSRELQNTNRGDYGVKKKKSKEPAFDTQDFCQACGDGGTLLCCPRCPVAMHAKCAGMNVKDFMCCSHHRCVLCNKNTESAGGLLFPCQSCPSAYCEDCRPALARLIGDCPRLEKLGFTTSRAAYIHCSDVCENVAKVEFGWKPASLKIAPCPPPLDTSEHFGASVVDDIDAGGEEPDDECDVATSLRSRRLVARPAFPVNTQYAVVRTTTMLFEKIDSQSLKKRRGLVGKENAIGNGPIVIDVDLPEGFEVIDVDALDEYE